MCAALRDRKVLGDLAVGAAFGRTIEDFATRRWRGRRRPSAGIGGFGALGPQDRNREKRALQNTRITRTSRIARSTRQTSPDSATTRPSHRGGWGETLPVYTVKLGAQTYGHRLEAGLAHHGMRRWARVARLTTNKTLGSRKTTPPIKLVFTGAGLSPGGGAAGIEK